MPRAERMLIAFPLPMLSAVRPSMAVAFPLPMLSAVRPSISAASRLLVLAVSLGVWAWLPGFAPGQAAAEVSVRAQLDPAVIEVGQRAVLQVTVEGAIRLDQGPQVPDVQGLVIRSAGQSTNVSFVNGRVSRSVTYQFVIQAGRPGTYNLGPVEVRDGGTLYRSEPVRLEVASSSGAASGSQGGSPGGPGSGGQGGTAGAAPRAPSGAGPSGDGDSTEGGELFVRAVLDDERLYQGEQITLRFQFYQLPATPLLESPQYTPPSTEGFWREDLAPQRSRTETVNGRLYQVTEITYALFPTQAGNLTIGPGHLDCTVRDRSSRRGSRDPFDLFGGFFSERRIRLSTRPLTVRVDPLPGPQPDDFTGGVGSYRIQAELERAVVAQNEPVTLIVTVEGRGNVSTVGDPELPETVGLRTYPSGAEVETARDGDTLGGRKIFRTVLISESTGRREIPPLHLSFFDPGAGTYRRVETQPLVLNVEAARPGSGAGGGPVTLQGRDLRTIRPATRLFALGHDRIWTRGGFWALQGIPAFLLGLALFWRARQRRLESDWGGVLSRGAVGRLRQEVEELKRETGADLDDRYDRLDRALERFFTDRYQFPVRGRTREDLLEVLQAGGASQEAAEQARTLLDRCDFARFAPQARTEEEFGRLCSLALEIARELVPGRRKKARAAGPGRSGTARLLLVAFFSCGLLPAAVQGLIPAGAAAQSGLPSAGLPDLTAEEASRAFERGNEAYGRGDYAEAVREYSRVLAGGFDSPDLMLNLGNSHYRSGQPGWAVFFYERGRRMDPADPDLRTNLQLALEESAGEQAEPGSSRFLEFLVRLQDRTSLGEALRWAAVFWWLLLLFQALRMILSAASGSVRGEGPAWRGAGIVIVILFGVSAAWAGMKALQIRGSPDAVVVAPELAVHSNPQQDATVEFTLQAGTRVELGRNQGGYTEVIFSPKLRGWADSQGLASLATEDLPSLRARLAARNIESREGEFRL